VPRLGFSGLHGIFFNRRATLYMFYTTGTVTFSCILMCSDIVHGGSVYHQGASCDPVGL
jgi:hypothetical protein